tara:strand:- start:5840 stop:6331 length:492 start_codon:yes stop_codon:yes gene_type:complete
MFNKLYTIGVLFFSLTLLNCQNSINYEESETIYKVNKSDKEWREQLSPEEYEILRNKGTERPNTGIYNMHFEEGVYTCKGCSQPLFKSNNKFMSDCGWPSYESAIPGAITYKKDTSLGMIRTEILCSNCGGHQGHVFDDGPTSTGKRYCVNSASINFINNKNE